MDNQQRITQMHRDGLISAEQAERLLAGLHTSPAPGPTLASNRRHSPLLLVAGLLVGITVILFLLLLFGNDSPMHVQNIEQWMHNDNQQGASTMLARSTSLALIILIPLTLCVIFGGLVYNSIVTREEATFSAWSQLESNYQRRHDLIPQLVESISRYLDHEKSTLADVTEQRSAPLAQAMDAVISAHKEAARAVADSSGRPPTDEQLLDRIAQSQSTLASQSRQLFAVVEDYPQLRSADQFIGLQAQLEGSENRINVARMRFNEAVQAYNRRIRTVPSNLIARAGGFQRKAYFRAEQEARNAHSLPFQ